MLPKKIINAIFLDIFISFIFPSNSIARIKVVI
jgi:hypothetical protein